MKRKCKMYSWERKRAPGHVMPEPRLAMKEEEKPGVTRNKRRGELRARPHLANPATCERKSLRNFLALKRNDKSKFTQM